MASWSAIARRVRVPLGFVFAILYFWLARPNVKSMLIGAALVIPGLVIRAVASGQLRKNEQLATGGPYAYSRNPLYLGSLILAIGFALASRSWWIAAGIVVLFFAIYLPVIRAEEIFLRERFPEFEEYSREVPRLFPRLSRRVKNSGSFSWDLYWQHREYNASIGALAMFAVLVVKISLWH
ncbi:MAG: isoprenylcysteine carboxylmethyltransferase family protein [Terriglobales bacterium]